jgi:hypothetical protein
MADFSTIYAAWDGNAEALAEEIGEKGVTVRQWRNRGSIPPEKWALIIEKAATRGHALTVADFGPNADVLAIAKALDAERDAA